MTNYDKARIELSRRLLAQRGVRTGPNGGCDNCPNLPACQRLDPSEEVICELDDETAGVESVHEGDRVRGNKLTWAA